MNKKRVNQCPIANCTSSKGIGPLCTDHLLLASELVGEHRVSLWMTWWEQGANPPYSIWCKEMQEIVLAIHRHEKARAAELREALGVPSIVEPAKEPAQTALF